MFATPNSGTELLLVFAQFSPEPEIPGALPNAPELGIGMGKKHTLGVGLEIGRNSSIGIVFKNSVLKTFEQSLPGLKY